MNLVIPTDRIQEGNRVGLGTNGHGGRRFSGLVWFLRAFPGFFFRVNLASPGEALELIEEAASRQ